MCDKASNPIATEKIFEVTLDGEVVRMPLEHKSLGAIRFYLEMLAMEQRRVLSPQFYVT